MRSSIFGGSANKASGFESSISGGHSNTASGCRSFVGGAWCGTASGQFSSVIGGGGNKAIGYTSLVTGGDNNTASGSYSFAAGGCQGYAYAYGSSVIGGGITGVSSCEQTARESVAIGKSAKTTKNYEVAIGSAYAPVKIGGNLTVTGTQTVTDGSTTKKWSDILKAGNYTLPSATSSVLGGVKIGSNITVSSGAISLTKANVVAALGYTPPTADTNTTYTAGSGLTLSGTAFSVKTDGDVVSGDTGIVTGGKVYDAITRMIQYDEGTNDTATLVGSSGTKLTNLKAGTLSKTSTDAVSGSQLYATNQNIAGFASDISRNKDNISNLNTSVTAALESVSSTSTLVNTLNSIKADASLNNLTVAGKQVIANAAANAVQEYMKANNSANSTVNTSLHTLNKNKSVDPASMSLMSVNPASADTNFVVYDDAQAFQITLEGPLGTGTKITNVAEGELSVASTDAVNGAQLYEVTQRFDDFQSALSSNNTSIANAQTDINKMKTANILLESDVNTLKTEMETGFNVTIDGAKVKTVNPENNYVDFVAGDGMKIEDDNGSVKFSVDVKALGGVTQEQLDKKADLTYVDEQLGLKADKDSVYTKTEADDLFVGKADMKDALNKKADKDASNIDVNAWSEKLGIGSVEEGNTGLVNGGAVYEAISRINGSDMIAADREAGSVRIAGNGRYDDFDVVDISKSDGSGRVLTGVATNPADKSSAANVGYVEAVGQNIANAVNDRFTRMDDRVNKVGANAAALSALTPASFEGDEKWSLAASVGNYRSATAGAVGAFYKPQENVMINVRGSFGNNENMIAGGVAVALNKGDVPGVTKRQLANAVNAQAVTIQNQANEIAELKEIVQQLVAERQSKK